jgi:multiple sugar transport system permease protein
MSRYLFAKKRAIRVVLWGCLIFVVMWSFGPILFVIVSSFKFPRDIFTVTPRLFFTPTIYNYRQLIAGWPDFWSSLLNSTLVTFGTCVLMAVLSCPAAYALSRMRGKAISITGLFLIIIRMFPPIVVSIPLYPVFTFIRLVDTPWSLILIFTAFEVSVTVWILKAFLDGIPKELEEAAWIDGCSKLRAFLYIVAPLLAPGIVSAGVITALYAWNEFMFSLVFTSIRAKTAPVVISEMLSAVTGVEWGPVFAAATLQLMPALLVIWAGQRYLVKGITLGGVRE